MLVMSGGEGYIDFRIGKLSAATGQRHACYIALPMLSRCAPNL